VSSLQFRVEAFAAHHLPAVAKFSERYWTRPRTESFYRWRYLESLPFSRLFIAMTDDECLGMVFALRKSYLINGTPAQFLEIFDWHSLPGLRGSGVGIRVMRAMMREGVPLLGVGGTTDVLKALPAMGWQTIGLCATFELPISGAHLTQGLRSRIPFRVPGEAVLLDTLTRFWFRPTRRSDVGQATPVSMIGDEIEPLYRDETGYDLLQVPDRALLKWMISGYPSNGEYRVWYFVRDDRVRGWALTRTYETQAGREAAILEVFAPKPDQSLYAWMVSEVAFSLAADRPRVIRARATCPVLQSAFRMNRFRTGSEVPVHVWPKMSVPPARLHVTLNHTDAPFRPYPGRDSVDP
jgi:hypothetical protein